MLSKLLEKIGLKKKQSWWQQVSVPFVILLFFLLFFAGSLVYLSNKHSEGKPERFGSGEVTRNPEMEKAYRDAIGPYVSAYLQARSVYQEQGSSDAYKKWLVVAEDTESRMLGAVVPAYYQEFHLSSFIALSLEISGLHDLTGDPIDAAEVSGTADLDSRGRSKLSTGEDRWALALEGQSDWLNL